MADRFERHRGNAEVVLQELASELGVTVWLRTVERACAPLRRELAARAWPQRSARATPATEPQTQYPTATQMRA